MTLTHSSLAHSSLARPSLIRAAAAAAALAALAVLPGAGPASGNSGGANNPMIAPTDSAYTSTGVSCNQGRCPSPEPAPGTVGFDGP